MKGDDNLGVFIKGVDPARVAAAEMEADRGKLAQALLDVLFDPEELAWGCATKPRKKNVKHLNDLRLNAIRGM